MTILYGCQTYTWQMSYERYRDHMLHILDVIRDAGFSGVEAEVCMLGRYYDDSVLFEDALQQRGLQLAALTLAEPWLGEKETREEKERADRLLGYLRHFPGTKLVTVQLPGPERANLRDRQHAAISCANAIARRAAEAGIESVYHPNSPAGSVFRTREDYDVLFAGLDDRYIGYCPDSGHIANGGMDVESVFRQHLGLIRHVHFKDFSVSDGQWRTMGQGAIDHPRIAGLLRDSGYDGWIMVEEESSFAEADPDEATLHNGRYIDNALKAHS